MLAVFVLVSPRSVQAHSSPTDSVPSINEVLDKSPTVLRVTFPIELDRARAADHSVELLTKAGELLPVGETTQVDDFTLQAPVTAELTETGTYIVRYLAYELEEGEENFTLSGFQFYFEPPESSNTLLFGSLIGGGLVILLAGGFMIRRSRRGDRASDET